MALVLSNMSEVGVGGVIRYGIELLVYHFVIYLIGGILAAIGFVLLSAGAESLGGLDPGVLLGAGIFFLTAWVVIVAGELGIIYKVITDAVVAGMVGFESRGSSRGSRTGATGTPSDSRSEP